MEDIFEKIRSKSRREMARQNFERNSACDANAATSTEDRIVNDQNGATGGAFVLGKYSASYNACETIAVHNAKVLLGMPSSLSETISRFHVFRAVLLKGFFGGNVYKIGRILRFYGVRSKRFFSRRRLAKEGLYIISFWNEKPLKNGLHTVALTFDGKEYTTYNLHGNGRAAHEDPREYGKRFIVGYYLGTTERGGTPAASGDEK